MKTIGRGMPKFRYGRHVLTFLALLLAAYNVSASIGWLHFLDFRDNDYKGIAAWLSVAGFSCPMYELVLAPFGVGVAFLLWRNRLFIPAIALLATLMLPTYLVIVIWLDIPAPL